MARRKGGNRKQGVVSWLINVFAVLFGLLPIWVRLGQVAGGSMSFESAAMSLASAYNPLSGDKEGNKWAYGSLVGGIVFKTVAGELSRRAKIRSLLPALHA